MKKYLTIMVLILTVIGFANGQTIRYVTPEGAGDNDGTSWDNAYSGTDLQTAIDEEGVTEVWVAKGTYYPTTGTDPSISFHMKNGVAIYGGYWGTDFSLRDPTGYGTNLDGGIGGSGFEDNSYHVIYNTGLINTAILDGFTIQGGNSTDFGGGIYNSASSPEFIHCTFSSNYANNGGGGMYNYNSSMPTLNNCTIKSNSTNGDGGGMYNSISSSPWMTDCTIMLNHAGIAGGGMSNYQSSPQMTNCWITENYALSGGGINTINSATLGLINCTIEENYTTVGNGGGMYNSGSTLELTNCYITGNYAATDGSNGGGIYNTGSTLTLTNCQLSNNIVNEDGGGICNVSSSLSLINCTITVNTANNGGGISNDGLAPTIKNSIIWGNSATSSGNQICNYSGTITLSYSCFANGTDNINNLETFTPDEYCINTNPRFFNPNNDFRIAGDSPCADAGNEEYNDEEFDIRGAINLRKLLKTNASQSGPIDMGAYEYNADNDPAEPEVFRIYVNANASGDNDGTSWTDAYTSLQDALTDAGRFYDIWVAAGTYYPTTGEDPDISFNMKNDVAIYGGFAGTETDFSERNWATYVTILSGDIGDAGVSSDNSTHVVFNSNVSSTAILDGFTIQGGMAIGGGGSGGGVCNEFSSPTFANCMITGNFALIGGGIGNSMDSSPQLSNCTITSNSASNSGGGVFNLGSSATLINCFISGNQSTSDGGGVFNSNSNTSLTNCTISDNSAQNGGGIGNYESSPEFTNCIISDNQAIGDGGGIYNLSNSSPTLINCTISGNISGANGGGVGNWNSLPLFVNCLIYMNSAISGGGIYNSSNSTLNNCTITGNTAVNGGGVYYLNSTSSSSIINNSIIWGNIASSNGNQIYYSNGTSTLRYSCYANETGDIHNNGGTFAPDAYCITDDPKFVFVAGNDFRIFGNSPCKNTGYNGNNATTVDIRGKARIQNITIDMGAYEYTEGFDPALPIVLRIYVNANATGLNNGTSWANAYTSLQTALSVATPGSEIWVAAATYKPTAGTERSISFSLKNGVAIYGGFAGTETDLSQRNWTTNVTILSGDIGTNGNNADNSYHVIHNTNLNNTAILDGFTITGGNVDIVSVGGGIINELSSPLVTNCTISENSAGSGGGGGIGNMDYSSPVFTNCIISGNHAVAFGGGIINEGHSTPIFTNCTISGNSAANGGGICNWNGNSLVMSNCTISNNNATNLGGGLYNIDNSSTSLISCTISGNQSNHGAGVYNTNAYLVLTNCLISGNTATSNGGGVCNALSITLINCTITGNHAANGGGIYNGSSSVVNNSIIWGNTAISGNQIYNYGVATMLDYSCYANGAGDVVNAGGTFTPINCITTDPKFVSVADNDYRIFGNSPCTNSGFNTYNTTAFDIRGQARIQNIIDMGAYEWTSSLDPGEVFTWTGTASSNWNSTDNWSSGTVPSAISVVSIPDVTTNDPIVNENPGSPAVCNDLMIETGAALTIAAGKALTVYGTLTNSAGTDGLVIKSDATGTGSLITNSTPNAKVERYVNAWIDATHGWHLLSSPVSSQAISTAFTDVTLANYDFYQWNEPTKNWLNQKDGGNSIINFVPGTGYLVAYAAAATKEFTGTLNASNITVNSLTRTGTTHEGWNLLGNPFPCAIQWNKTIASWALNNINSSAKIWNEAVASYTDIAQNGIIPAMQGFMVQVSTGTSGSLVIPAVDRLHDATSWYKNTEGEIRLVANDPENSTAQESIIKVTGSATDGFDPRYDSHFLAGYAPLFYSTAGSEQLSTNTLPGIDNSRIIPFEFVKNTGTNFSIELAENSINGVSSVYLTDIKTGIVTNLSKTPSYNFTASETDDAGRFSLSFATTYGINPEISSGMQVYTCDKILFITQTDPQKGAIWIYTTTGQLVRSQSMESSTSQSISLQSFPPGVYVVTIQTEKGLYNQKVVVK